MGEILPLAVAMVIGPQIMTSVFLVTSREPVRNSFAYLGGVAVALCIGTLLGVGLASLLGVGDDASSDGTDWSTYVFVGLLGFLSVDTFRRRHELEPPKWMGELQAADAGLSARIGLLLFLLMPTDIILMLGVGNYLVANGSDWFGAIPFIALTLLLVAVPVLVYLAIGPPAERRMPAIRDWMVRYSWLISMIVYGFFIVLLLG